MGFGWSGCGAVQKSKTVPYTDALLAPSDASLKYLDHAILLDKAKRYAKNYVWMFSMLAFLAGHSKVVTKRRIEATAAERLKNWQNGQIHCPYLPDTSSLL